MNSKHTFFIVDVESDGPVPGLFSMLEIGAVAIRGNTRVGHYKTQLAPITDRYEAKALEVNGLNREVLKQTGGSPWKVMGRFKTWVGIEASGTIPVFVSDNPGFDFAFVSYYLHRYTGWNLFGHTSRSVADLYRGSLSDPMAEYSKYREPMTHRSLSDAKVNAEAFLRLLETWATVPLEFSYQDDERRAIESLEKDLKG